jgi:hypothetical protein
MGVSREGVVHFINKIQRGSQKSFLKNIEFVPMAILARGNLLYFWVNFSHSEVDAKTFD